MKDLWVRGYINEMKTRSANVLFENRCFGKYERRKNRAGVRDNKHVRFLVDVELLL